LGSRGFAASARPGLGEDVGDLVYERQHVVGHARVHRPLGLAGLLCGPPEQVVQVGEAGDVDRLEVDIDYYVAYLDGGG
jgi:hypothetical protein